MVGDPEPAPQRPVHPQHAHLRLARNHCHPQACRRLLHGEGEHPLALQPRSERVPPGEIADLPQMAPVDHRGRQSETATVVGKGVEGRVGGGIVGLAGVAENARQRGIKDKPVELEAERLLMEVPAPEELRQQDTVERGMVEVDEELVLENHRGVKNPLQRRQLGADPVEHPPHLLRPGDVGRHGYDARAAALQLSDRCGRFGRHPGTAAAEDERAGALRRQPAGGLEAEAPEPSRDPVGGRGVERHTPPYRRPGSGGALVVGDHHLADVPGLLHRSEGRGSVVGAVHRHRQRLELPRLQPRHEGLQRPPHALRLLLEELVEIDGEEGDVVAEGMEPEGSVGVDVALADLEEPAADRQRLDAARDRLPGEAVEHEVEPLRHDPPRLVGERQAPRAHHVLCPGAAHPRALFVVPGRRQDPRPGQLGQLDCGEPHPPRGRMDQERLAGPDPAAVMEGVNGGQKRDRQRGRLVVREVGRLAGQKRRGDDDMRGESPRCHRDHRRADLPSGDAWTDAADRPRDLAPQRHRAGREPRIEIEGLHDVAEVQPRGPDLDLNLIDVERPGLEEPVSEIVDPCGVGHLEARRQRCPGRRTSVEATQRMEAPHPPPVGPQQHFVLGRAGEELGNEGVERRQGHRRQIDEPRPQPADLVGHDPRHPHQRPLRHLERLRRTGRGLGAGGHEAAGGGRRIGLLPSLNEMERPPAGQLGARCERRSREARGGGGVEAPPIDHAGERLRADGGEKAGEVSSVVGIDDKLPVATGRERRAAVDDNRRAAARSQASGQRPPQASLVGEQEPAAGRRRACGRRGGLGRPVESVDQIAGRLGRHRSGDAVADEPTDRDTRPPVAVEEVDVGLHDIAGPGHDPGMDGAPGARGLEEADLADLVGKEEARDGVIKIAVGGDHRVEATVEEAGMNQILPRFGFDFSREHDLADRLPRAPHARDEPLEPCPVGEPEPLAVGIEPLPVERFRAPSSDVRDRL